MQSDFQPTRQPFLRRLGKMTGFLSPIVLGLVLFTALTQSGQAQQAPSSVLNQLQQAQSGLLSNSQSSQQLQPDVVLRNGQQPQQTLPSSRLEQIMSQRAGVQLHQFGYDELGAGRDVTVPQTGSVQDDYVMGPGDEVVVSMRGQELNLFNGNVSVDRNGQVVIPRLPPIAASGRTFGSFRQDLQDAVARAYVATTASASISKVRQISVLVSGEVNNPGQRSLTGLSSAVDAILLSGGVKKTGSLRNVRILRGGHEYAVDLYSVLTDRGTASSLRLADGDRILVPTLGPTVAVTGLVRRPGIFELPARQSGITIRNLLALAGGPEVRGRYRYSALRISPNGSSAMAPLANDGGTVQDSEILFVQLSADQNIGQITLSGGTGLAGQYPASAGSKLSEMLKAPGALGPAPYTLFGIIVRKDPRTLLRSLVAFTPVSVINGGEDETLQGDDLVRPISVNEAHLIIRAVCTYTRRQSDQAADLRNPLDSSTNRTAAPGENTEIPNQIPRECNPTGAGAKLVSTTINADPNNPATPTTVTPTIRYPVVDQFGDTLQEITQMPQNGGVAAQSGQASAAVPQANSAAAVPQTNPGANGQAGANGNSLANGMDQLQQPALNYQNLSVRRGEFANNQEVTSFAELSQQLGIDPVTLVNFLADHRAQLEGAVRAPGFYLVGPNVELSDLVQAAGGTIDWADQSGVELISTAVNGPDGRAVTRRQSLPLRQGMLANYTVRAGDQVHFNKVFTDVVAGNVSVQGEVHAPGSYAIVRGEHLTDLLARAGGLTSTAYPYGTVFLRKSAAETEHEGYMRVADEIQNVLLVGLTRTGTNQIATSTFSVMQDFLKQLRNQRALGRISIIADPSVLASKPDLDPLLEPGDVIYIPQRPSTVSVLGQVMREGSYPYQPGKTVKDYIDEAGDYAQFSDEGNTFLVLPDGTAHKVDVSWFSFDSKALPPGSAIVVPRDLQPFDLRQTIIDTTSVLSQIAVTVASLAVLAKQ